MTKTTKQDRAEFEAWAESEGYSIRRGFGKLDDYDFVETRRMWLSWQEARRAPVVPQGWKLVPIEPTMEMVSAGDIGRKSSAWLIGGANAVPAVYAAMLAAAPQPTEANSPGFDGIKTEAAPVELPEPYAVVGSGYQLLFASNKTIGEIAKQFGAPVGTKLYTEQQVRELFGKKGQ